MKPSSGTSVMNILVIDVGGTHIKLLATGQQEAHEIPSGLTMTAARMVQEVKRLAKGWNYEAISIGFPGPVVTWAPLARTLQSGHGLGRVRFPEGTRPPRQDHQRRRYAGSRKLQKGPNAFPGTGHRSRVRHDC